MCKLCEKTCKRSFERVNGKMVYCVPTGSKWPDGSCVCRSVQHISPPEEEEVNPPEEEEA